jgi:hypothetical protein
LPKNGGVEFPFGKIGEGKISRCGIFISPLPKIHFYWVLPQSYLAFFRYDPLLDAVPHFCFCGTEQALAGGGTANRQPVK